MSRNIVVDSTLVRLGVAAAVGVGAGFAVVGFNPLWAPLVGWIVTAVVFCGSTWWSIRGMDAGEVRDHATREDAGRAVGDIVLLVACVAGIVGVGMLLLAGSNADGHPAGDAAVGVLTVVASWFTAHMLYTLRYAREHWTNSDHGIDIEGEDPTYVDFAYVAYTIGMTYQVSDTTFKSRALRATALRHALLSFFLGAVVVACTINLVVQLASSGG